ncbi:MAG: hypothetical protein MUF49_10730 [Oculatellaceae cyanobacterium Prado106]|jgi:hypothetical protein|nr:hypothetical protein [Oculatellaceae cyanobacterium Prado106]
MENSRFDVEKDPIPINKLFGQRASIGPIPASQVAPWMMLGTLTFFIVRMVFAGSLTVWFIIWIWLAASYWILTGDRAYRFFKRWVPPPGEDWINGETLFIPVTQPGLWKRKTRTQIRPIPLRTREGGIRRFMPFQSFSHLHSIAEIKLGGHRFACLLLYNPQSQQWSAQIPFRFAGYHPQLYRHEVEAFLDNIQRCMTELFDGESVTFHLSCRSDVRSRTQALEDLARNSPLAPVSVLLFNEQQRVAELSQRGVRQVWDQVIWVFWTAQKSSQDRTDLIGKTVTWLQQTVQKFARSLAGTEQIYFQDFYLNLARQIHEYGYLPWRNLLETKAELALEAMTGEELYQTLWNQFNTRPCSIVPEIIRIAEGEKGLEQIVPIAGQKDLTTRLIQGQQGQSACPKHKRQTGYLYCNGQVGKVVVLEEPPDHWRSAREALRWIWNRMSASYVRDTEVVVQITPRERWIVQDELEKMNRQSFTQRRRAIAEGTGKMVHANLQDEYTSDALRKILEGRKPLYCAPVFIVWRSSERECDEAVVQICNAFESANAIVENDIAWRVWVESLPINDFSLLTKFSVFSERRMTLDSESVVGFIPLTRPRELDVQGVEFLTEQGGAPLYIDLFPQEEPQRIVVTGATGSGKSVAGWRFIELALAAGIPVVGMDLSTGGNSTFQLAIQMLGDQAAYVDILQEHLNLLEPPDLRNLDPKIQTQRFKRWKDFTRQSIVAIAMGQIHDQALLERVDSITLRLLEIFFADAEMIERYNVAFEQGWQSEAWQQMPTLHDLLKFCSKEKLGLESFEAMDALAINQIVSQVGAKLVDPNVGDMLAKPSSVPPNARILFYALSGLTNENNSYIMALSAQMACLRNALAHPRSLFVGDELSVLLSKRGFAELIGEQFATGRKEGLAILILAQDLDAIADCSASAKILANLSTTITGCTTHAATRAYIDKLGFPNEVILPTATEKFKGSRPEMFTRWLISRQGRFWDTRFYAAPMMLAALANGEDEKLARQRILSQYPQTQRGYVLGLSQFTQEYIQAMRGSKRLQDIGLNDFERFQQRHRHSAKEVV